MYKFEVYSVASFIWNKNLNYIEFKYIRNFIIKKPFIEQIFMKIQINMIDIVFYVKILISNKKQKLICTHIFCLTKMQFVFKHNNITYCNFTTSKILKNISKLYGSKYKFSKHRKGYFPKC